MFKNLAVALLFAAVFCGCSPEQQPAQPQKRVGLVTDVGKVDDKTFNQFAYEGMVKAAAELSMPRTFIETMQPTDYEKNIQQLIDEGYGLLITVGYMLGDATGKMAGEHPEVKFAIVDFAYDTVIPNVMCLTFAEDQAGFIVGALAGMMTRSGIIGFVGGKEIPPVRRYLRGYEAGARYVRPDVKVLGAYTDSFTDPARGKATAESQISEGADVIFGAGGVSGSGGIKAAHEQGVFCIGVDKDEYHTTFGGGPAPYLLTSAMKRVDQAVYDAIIAFDNGTFAGSTYLGTAANGGIGYAPFHDAQASIPADVQQKLEEIRQGLADGSLQTGVTG